MEFKARLLKEEDGKAIIEVRSFKIAVIPKNPEFESSIDMLADPPLSTISILNYEIPIKNSDKEQER